MVSKFLEVAVVKRGQSEGQPIPVEVLDSVEVKLNTPIVQFFGGQTVDLDDLIETLEKHLDQSESEAERNRDEADNLTDDLRSANEQIGELTDEITRLKAENEELKAENLKLSASSAERKEEI